MTTYDIITFVVPSLIIAFLILLFARPKKTAPEPPPDVASINKPTNDTNRKEWLDLKKLEYQLTTERYENIYRAIWQNFSYLAVLAGGILTFGGKVLEFVPLVALALTPLVFWFLATFLPLDYYGDRTRARASDIEREINAILFSADNDPKLRHFISFKDSKFTWRVQDAVVWTGRMVIVFWSAFVVLTARDLIDRMNAPRVPIADYATSTRDSLAQARQRLESVDRMLQITVQCLRAPQTQTRPPSC